MSQISFSDAELGRQAQEDPTRGVGRRDGRRCFTWKALLGLIEPHYPVAGRGRRPYPLESTLRVHLMQNLFALSDPAMDEAVCAIASLRAFGRLSLGERSPTRRPS